MQRLLPLGCGRGRAIAAAGRPSRRPSVRPWRANKLSSPTLRALCLQPLSGGGADFDVRSFDGADCVATLSMKGAWEKLFTSAIARRTH